jgi:hypothetical protein
MVTLYKGVTMKKLKDEILIEKAMEKIKDDTQTAIAMLCVGLAHPKGFKDEFEWSYALGNLFSMMMESGFHTKNTELFYNEAGETIIDEKISDILSKCDVIEKTNMAAFLMAATKPSTQKDIDFFVGQLR